MDTIVQSQPEYPRMLHDYPAAPERFFCEGDVSLLNTKTIAIIGTRHPTPIAEKRAMELGYFFARAGWTILSGLAIGCDAAAHRGALTAGGKTIAMLPCSLGYILPRTNELLSKQIVKAGGLLVTAYAEKRDFEIANYEQRDYLQAALSVAVIPVQGQTTSGTRYASWKAVELGRLTLIPRPHQEDVNQAPGKYGLLNALIESGKSLPFDYSRKGVEDILPILERHWMTLKERIPS